MCYIISNRSLSVQQLIQDGNPNKCCSFFVNSLTLKHKPGILCFTLSVADLWGCISFWETSNRRDARFPEQNLLPISRPLVPLPDLDSIPYYITSSNPACPLAGHSDVFPLWYPSEFVRLLLKADFQRFPHKGFQLRTFPARLRKTEVQLQKATLIRGALNTWIRMRDTIPH